MLKISILFFKRYKLKKMTNNAPFILDPEGLASGCQDLLYSVSITSFELSRFILRTSDCDLKSKIVFRFYKIGDK